MLIGQRVFVLALEYAGLNAHERLRHDPVCGALLSKLEQQRRVDCAAQAGRRSDWARAQQATAVRTT